MQNSRKLKNILIVKQSLLINECESDLRCSENYLSSSENKAWKYFVIWQYVIWVLREFYR